MKDYKYINTNDYVELLASWITMQEIFDNWIIVKYN
jgi:hypothetical protein